MGAGNKAPLALMGKSLKIFITEAMRPIAIFSMLQCLVVPYINPTNEVPEVKTCHTLGINSSHRLIVGKTYKIFSETIYVQYIALSNASQHKSCHSIPWGSNWPSHVDQ